MLLVLVVAGGLGVGSSVLNDLLVFLNLFIRSSHRSRLKIVQNTSVLFDSVEDLEEDLGKVVGEAFSCGTTRVSSDFGYSLLLASKEKEKSRIVVFSSNEANLDFIKCSFTSKKLQIPVSCVSSGNEGVGYQVSDLFGNLVCDISKSESGVVFRYLVSILGLALDRMAPNRTERECVCHGKGIEKGYLCPICLGLYCKFVPLCRHCKTKFVF